MHLRSDESSAGLLSFLKTYTLGIVKSAAPWAGFVVRNHEKMGDILDRMEMGDHNSNSYYDMTGHNSPFLRIYNGTHESMGVC